MDKELIINGLKYRLAEEDNNPVYKFNGLLWTKTFEKMPWQEAMDFCRSLNYGGYSDWQLPSRIALLDITNEEKCNPVTLLPDTKLASYWTSNTYAAMTDYAWSVGLDYGNVYSYNKSVALYVRAVRGVKKEK